MLDIHGVQIDFDITCPQDLRRYRSAGEKMKSAAQGIPDPPDGAGSEETFEQYVAFIEAQCRLATDFIDEAFGEGVCDQLLGPKTSLEKLLDLCDEIGRAVERQGSEFGVKLTRYKPNRTTRRTKA